MPQSQNNDQKQNSPLQVTMRTREKLLYKGVATTVSSENERGPFDILVSHANFISLIHNYVTIDHGLPTEQSFQMEKGVMYVASNTIDIYVGI